MSRPPPRDAVPVMLTPIELRAILAALDAQLATNPAWLGERRVRRLNGTYIWEVQRRAGKKLAKALLAATGRD